MPKLADAEMPSHFAPPLLKDRPKSQFELIDQFPSSVLHMEIGNQNAGKMERENHVSRHDDLDFKSSVKIHQCHSFFNARARG